MITANQSFNEFKYGVKLQGTNTSVGQFYYAIAVGTGAASTAVNVFGSATAPANGTITGFGAIAAGTNGNLTLFGTTAGTIASINTGTSTGVFQGTAVLNAAVVAGDTVTITYGASGGTATALVWFQTAS